MKSITEDQRALFLLLSVLLYLILTPFLQGDRVGEMILVFSLYVIMVAASVELAANHLMVRPTIPLAIISVVLGLVHFFHPPRAVTFLNFTALVVFLGFVAVGLFLYLGRPGAITPGHLYGSVSLVARIFAGLESATGLLYIAITVARLVSGYQRAAGNSSRD